jgi:hypothetical protein
MADAEPNWREFMVLFSDLGVHEDGNPRGRSYYEDELEEELERLGLGEVVGGGTWMDGSGCNMTVEVSDPQAGLRVIREVLRRLAAPASTRIVRTSGELTGEFTLDE